MLKYLAALCLLVIVMPSWSQTSDKLPERDKQAFSLDEVQYRHFRFFWELAHPENFQVPDRYPRLDFSSIAATGFGLSAYLVGAERGWVTRVQAAERVLNTLRVLKNLPQGPQESGVAGYRGWFYHFLTTDKALRFKQVELSSIDTGLLMAGVLSCMTYFDGDTAMEKEIRETADFLYRRVEFDWFMNKNHCMSMGWHPERDGFLNAEWRGYNEAMLLVIMALGSPTHPLPANAWDAWSHSYYRTTFKGQDMINFGPLFGHQYSHCWIDFKGIYDEYNRKSGFDYFENSRRATLANRQYCIDNPKQFKGYGPDIWGLTAGDGPDAEMMHRGEKIFCPGYDARGVAVDYLTDDGTIAPTAAISSLPFAPEVCLPTLEAMWKRWPVGPYGFFDGYNETFTDLKKSPNAQAGYDYWVDRDYLGIDQGPIVLMIENYRSGFLWNLMKKNPYIVKGLQRARFTAAAPLQKEEKIQKGNKEQPFWPESPAWDAIKKMQWADGEKARANLQIPLDPNGFFQRLQYTDKEGNQLPYQLASPAQYSKSAKPLIIFLHGSGERGKDNHSQMKNGVHAFCEQWVREKYPHYLIVPQCPTDMRWGGSSATWQTLFAEKPTPAAQMVLEIIEKTMREHPDIDPKRVYLVGLSMGGFGTFDLLMRRPDLFAAAIPVCGGGDPQYAERIKKIPVWAFHGALDETVLPRCSRQIVDALKSIKGNIRYTEYSTMKHGIWNETFYNPAVMDWLFAQKKE